MLEEHPKSYDATQEAVRKACESSNGPVVDVLWEFPITDKETCVNPRVPRVNLVKAPKGCRYLPMDARFSVGVGDYQMAFGAYGLVSYLIDRMGDTPNDHTVSAITAAWKNYLCNTRAQLADKYNKRATALAHFIEAYDAPPSSSPHIGESVGLNLRTAMPSNWVDRYCKLKWSHMLHTLHELIKILEDLHQPHNKTMLLDVRDSAITHLNNAFSWLAELPVLAHVSAPGAHDAVIIIGEGHKPGLLSGLSALGFHKINADDTGIDK